MKSEIGSDVTVKNCSLLFEEELMCCYSCPPGIVVPNRTVVSPIGRAIHDVLSRPIHWSDHRTATRRTDNKELFRLSSSSLPSAVRGG